MGSPPGGSTFSTSAPRSARIWVAWGMGRHDDTSSTRIPSSGWPATSPSLPCPRGVWGISPMVRAAAGPHAGGMDATALTVDDLVEATPTSRDRYVDLLRAV